MELNERKPNRLKEYDYSSNGMYFVTICTKKREHYFSEVSFDDKNAGYAALGVPHIKMTHYGKIVNENILKINQIYKYVSVLNYVIMPDHVHLIIFVSDDENISGGTLRAASTTRSVSQIINALKTISTKQIGFSLWQRSFHDHIIRSEAEFRRIWQYIDDNPVNWANDIYNQNIWR